MSEPLTPTGRRLVARHAEKRSWPSTRNDPAAQSDGYIHYCAYCFGRSYPCEMVKTVYAIEAEMMDRSEVAR